MQLTSFTDCALRTLLYLAQLEPGKRAALDEIGSAFGMKRNQLIKVSQKLVQLDLVNSSRGKQGGVWLARPASQLNLGRIVEALESRLDPVDCDGLECPIRYNCGLQGILNGAMRAFIDHLNRYTLADLVNSPGHASIEQVLRFSESAGNRL